MDSCFKDNHINAVTAEITGFNRRKKSQKDVVYFQPEDNREQEGKKFLKKLQVQTRVANFFSF